MSRQQKIVIVSQHYPPDRSTTAAIFCSIAERLAVVAPVLVLSGAKGAVSHSARLSILAIPNRMAAKTALTKRAVAELIFVTRTFFSLLRRLDRNDLVITVTAPFLLPYAVVAAAYIKRAKSILVLHDLFPDVLIVAGVTGPNSVVARALRAANYLMFGGLTAIVTIGRDTARLIEGYGARAKVRLIPNWTTLECSVRPLTNGNPYRSSCRAPFVVGLSGNLGFTHDPLIVFEAASLLRNDATIHFLLSGWGMGFEQLKAKQTEAKLPNVTLVDRVKDGELENLLSAADIWIIPYRRDTAGVSTPSRLYNILAVGRPVIVVSEVDAEAALTVSENNLGWVVTPDRPEELATALRSASVSKDPLIAERAVEVAKTFGRDRAVDAYAHLAESLLTSEGLAGRVA